MPEKELKEPDDIARDVVQVTVMSCIVRNILDNLGIGKDLSPEVVDQIIITKVLEECMGGEE